MSISAMPVIAKILVDLDLTKRNIGLVILSAGVVDDTVGWLILSLIAGAATHGAVHVGDLGLTIVYLIAFIVGRGVRPPSAAARADARRRPSASRRADTDLVRHHRDHVPLRGGRPRRSASTPSSAPSSPAWCCTRCRALRRRRSRRLESFDFGVLAPIFFGIVGLRSNLWDARRRRRCSALVARRGLRRQAGRLHAGRLWGGLRFWEAASIAVAMNARGAMEIVVATIGLSLGILNPQMFSIIVMVAIVTSFMAPVGLRLTMPRVRMTEDEARRILASRDRRARSTRATCACCWRRAAGRTRSPRRRWPSG